MKRTYPSFRPRDGTHCFFFCPHFRLVNKEDIPFVSSLHISPSIALTSWHKSSEKASGDPRSPSTAMNTSSPPPPPSSSNGLTRSALAGLIVGVVLGAGLMLIGMRFLYRRKMRQLANAKPGTPSQPGSKDNLEAGLNAPPPGEDRLSFLTNAATSKTKVVYQQQRSRRAPSSAETLGTISFEELDEATDGFSDANLLGQGGFGYVHKGILRDGKVVAIKQLKAGSGQGEREFQAEIEIINRIHHRHLVSLFGYCILGAHRILVYEFVPNGTLEYHLHGKDRPTMEWATRMKVAIGSAKGLLYLHEDCRPKIIHRDIKAANILLDHSFEAKVADFGLARYSPDFDTHVSTRVVGTIGYLAPEYASSGKLTEKSDIFSFGVVLLELITGRQPIDRTQSDFDDSIVDWARPLLKQALENKNYDAFVDPKLSKDYDSHEMERMVSCAAACLRYSAKYRPRMSQIVRALEGNMSLEELSEGSAIGHSRIFSSDSSEYSTAQYSDDLKRFKELALGSLVQEESGPSGGDNAQQSSVSTTDGHETDLQAKERNTLAKSTQR